jgi:hypothetical protein
VETVSFSAHVDFVQNRDFITRVNPGHIVLVHGSGQEMSRLRNAMKVVFNKYASSPAELRDPANPLLLHVQIPGGPPPHHRDARQLRAGAAPLLPAQGGQGACERGTPSCC